jgi:hypothetical protein
LKSQKPNGGENDGNGGAKRPTSNKRLTWAACLPEVADADGLVYPISQTWAACLTKIADADGFVYANFWSWPKVSDILLKRTL